MAPRYPLPENTKWYEGTPLRATSQLVGRVDTLGKIIESLEEHDNSPKLIALTGIGGIGYEYIPSYKT